MGKMNSSTRLVYKSCRNDGTSALKLAEIMWKNKLVNVVVLCFFRNFWNNPRICPVWGLSAVSFAKTAEPIGMVFGV